MKALTHSLSSNSLHFLALITYSGKIKKIMKICDSSTKKILLRYAFLKNAMMKNQFHYEIDNCPLKLF